MGISVPIGAEQYNKLKAISDKLGLGLKKTMEYLVSYYWQKEMEQSDTKSKKVKPDIDESREEAPPVVQSKEVEPIVQSIEVKPIRQLLEELSKEYDLQPSNIMTSTSLSDTQSMISPNSSTIKEDSSQIKPIISSLQNKAENCPSCGITKRLNAKFCHNCGSLL